MASPHTAGAAALYLETNPSATPSQVEQAIKSNATPNRIGSMASPLTPNLLVYTLNFGGGGTRPQEKEALFFAFDPVTKKKTFEAAFVPGARSYPATLAASGRIYTTAGDTLLIVDPETKSVRKRLQLPGAQVEIALGLDSRGRVVGLTRRGVYVLDTKVEEIVHAVDAQVAIGCGFALIDDCVYFGSGVELWRYELPDGD